MLGNPVKSPTKFILLCYNEFVRIIKYFDRIHSKYVDVEVTDEVARFLLANDKYLRRLQKRYNYYTVSLEKVIYSTDDGEDITLAEAIPEKHKTNSHVLDKKRRKLYELVWKIVSRLEKREQKLIKYIFVENKSQKQIAQEFGISTSAVSQFKQTTLLHLSYYFYTDKEFMQTEIYKQNKREFNYDLMRVAKGIDNKNGLKFDLNKIQDFVKDNTQTLKMLSALGIELDEREKELFTFMNRTVKQFLDGMKLDKNKKSIITIPKDLEIPDNLKFNK